MSENEEAKVVEDTEDVEDIEDTETTDWKAEAEKLREKAIVQREKTKALKAELAKLSTPPAVENKQEIDYAKRAYIRSEGIVGDEVSLVENWAKDTGKKIEDIIANPRFQAELKDFREAKVTKEAVPVGSKRSAPSAQNTPEYWIAKGETPPNTPENRKLRQDIVNAKIAAEKPVNPF